MRKVINGIAYDTETSTEVFAISSEHTHDFWAVYQTRHGAFFKVRTAFDQEAWDFSALTDPEARALVEQYANHLVEQFFGEGPEYGAAERRLTLRMAIGLAKKVELAASIKKLTVSRYITRSLERSTAEDLAAPKF